MCNHPELFERADVVAPFSFSHFGRSGPLMREGDFVPLSYSTRNPIEFSIPELFYQDGGLLNVPSENHNGHLGSGYLTKLLNIWSTDWIQHSLYNDDNGECFNRVRSSRRLNMRQLLPLSRSSHFLTCLRTKLTHCIYPLSFEGVCGQFRTRNEL